MSLLAEHLFNPKSRERLQEDLRRISEQGRRELKELVRRQHKALRPPSHTSEQP
jgi:hypothetical protein